MDGKWNPGTLGNPYGGTMLMVFVNSGMGWGVQGTPQIDFEYHHEEERFGYYTLAGEWTASGRLPEAGDGYYELVYDSDGSTIFWFTRDGRLPFRYVSREAFIRRQIDILQAGKAADQKRMAGAQNARMTELTYDKPLADYQDMLQKPAAWLQQPAICLMGSDGGRRDYARCEFLDAPQPRAQVPVEPEPGYFNRALPRSAPQYITIDLRANGHADAAARQRELIEANSDTFLSLLK